MNFTAKQKAWIILICMLVGTGCASTAAAYAGGCKLWVAICLGLGTACTNVVHAMMKSPKDVDDEPEAGAAKPAAPAATTSP